MFVVAALLAGCKTWQTTSMSPSRLIEEQRPASVRVTTDGGATVTLSNPMIVADSIVASEAPPPGLAFIPPRVGVVSDDVRTLEVARFSAPRTLGLAAVVALAAATWATLASQSAGGSTPPGGDLPKDPFVGLSSALRVAWRIFP